MITRITPEEMETIFNYMENQTWKTNYKDEKILNIKESSDYRGSHYEPPILAKYAEELLRDRLKEQIQDKVKEIISSEEFINKSEQIAQEIVDYATEGYKNDLKLKVYERMVGNVIDHDIRFNNECLIDIIRNEINNFISSRGGYSY